MQVILLKYGTIFKHVFSQTNMLCQFDKDAKQLQSEVRKIIIGK